MDITEAWATRPADPPASLLSRWLFLRLLGVAYLIAFVSLAVQVSGLVGERGILPAGSFLQRAHALYGAAAYRLLQERSEEHTSELQSRLHLVCPLLLE